jgi:hypothetical protein
MAQIKLRNPFDEPTPTSLAQSNHGPMVATTPQDNHAPEPTVRLSVDLERSLHRRLRRWALDRDRTASDLIRELLTSALDAAGH